jgi:hypothetical protein
VVAVSTVIVLCGLTVVVVAGWRSYALAREALAPLAHPVEGDPTRREIEASQPLPMRPRVRRFARSVLLSFGWLVVCFYGLYLMVAGGEVGR